MQQTFVKQVLLCVLIALCFVGCSPKMAPIAANDITASVYSPKAPLIIGLAHNPTLRIRVHVPAGSAPMRLSGLKLSLNSSAVAAIEQLQVYHTGTEAGFNNKTPLATHTPIQEQATIPLSVDVQPGLNYLWVSATLKPKANMDGTVLLQATAVTDNNGNNYSLANASDVTPKRIAIAARKAWDDSVHTYRIPGIITTDKGTLIAVYDIRYKHSGDLPANVDVGMSRSTDGGRTWEPMKIIMDMGAPHESNGVGDPSILFDPVTKKIWVSALWSKGNRSIAGSQPGLSPDETGQFVLVSSSDDGLSWTAPHSITPQVKNPAWKLFFPGPGNGIAMQNGRLVFPAQYWDGAHMPHSTLVYSDDHGATWKSGIGAKSNTTEAQLVETAPGTIMINMRDNRGRYRSVATTADMGKTWTEHRTSYSALIDPVCMASFIRAKVRVGGKLQDVLFFSNVASQTAREDMSIKASLDMGETWPARNKLLVDERRSFGYSALTPIDENTMGLLYEGERDLYFIRVPVSEIIK
ncbi:sialidase family protein [Paracnuella aquatica]|uniref:sialidase family protein n=1 Tax=Paracnuella aquatica TaxID=2268757 RepID=UPI000DEFD78C|nr:sialidase family protein [Paracnuella aquatica]RPD45579.1 glycosyl hydrolase [Paracnuella aquatica]